MKLSQFEVKAQRRNSLFLLMFFFCGHHSKRVSCLGKKEFAKELWKRTGICGSSNMLIRLGNDYRSNQTYFIYVYKMASAFS